MAKILLIFGFFFVCQVITADDEQINYFDTECDNSISNRTAAGLEEHSKFLTTLLTNVSYQASNVKFYNVTAGEFPNKVYVLFQCVELLSQNNCRNCVDSATTALLTGCHLHDEAIVWYHECMMRYAHRNIFSLNETSPFSTWANFDVLETGNLTQVVNKAVDEVIEQAVAGLAAMDSVYKSTHFAETETDITPYGTLYCFAQCSPDITPSECQSCLETAFKYITDCCPFKLQADSFLPSCQLRHDNQIYFLQSPLDAEQGIKKQSSMVKIVIPLTIVLPLLAFFLLYCGWRWQKRHGATTDGIMDDITSVETLRHRFAHIKNATNEFSEENRLGQGGFGDVYKGTLPDGVVVAVKRLSKNSQQGISEFKNEVRVLARLQHNNLVKLKGFCTSRTEKILIYEFLPNSSLDRFIFDREKRSTLVWNLRFKIIKGAAKGILYLHEDSRLMIIHLDLKPSNILLDEEMNAKIADFGLAKSFNQGQTHAITETRAGTFGYMAPEYAIEGNFSVKSDVYSFGVIILEIVSGQTNRRQQPDDEGLLAHACRLWNANVTAQLVDPLLSNIFSEEEEEQVRLCIHIGLLCIQEEAQRRPTMATIVAALTGGPINLPSPTLPQSYPTGVAIDAISISYNLPPENEMPRTNSRQSNGGCTGLSNMSELSPR